MMQGDQLLEGVVVRGRVEIDTRKPFRSVKEAVALFGERIHAGEVNKLKEVHAKGSDLVVDLNETRQSLRKEKEEEKVVMLDSLRQELEQTKKELYQLKAKEKDKPTEIEEIKFVEPIKSPEVNNNNNNNYNSYFEDHSDHSELHRKRSVKFASPPLLTKVITSEDDHVSNGVLGGKMNPLLSNNKIKKKPLVPLFIGKLFSKKQRSKDLTAKS